MVNEFKKIPCVVEFNEEFFKVDKPEKFFNRHREMENDSVIIRYIDENITDRREIAIALRDLEDSLKGIVRVNKQQEGLRECPFKYRVNANTVLMAYTEEDLNKLKMWHNIT